MVEIKESAFEREVLAASAEAPVLVDFWAPWCGPCRMLGPVLERLEESYGGRFKLVKINSDESPELAARYGVRSIPYVMAFVGGEAVDSFVGVVPEGQVRAFLDGVIPSPAERERLKALRLAHHGDLDGAAGALRTAIALDPTHDRARLDLAELLIERMPSPVDSARLSEAESELAAVRSHARKEARWRALDTRVSSLRTAASLPSSEDLRERVSAEPGNVTARLELAQRYIAQRQLEPALEQLLEVIARDPKAGDGEPRRMMLSIFELMADRPQFVSDYRRKLSALINR